MLQDRDVQITDFIKFTAGGVKIADYDQIQAALVKRYKEIYGSDIDLSNVTADGIFVNDLALIVNNILQSFKNLYANLDVDNASGVYLETLCRLSNVTRKQQSKSVANLELTSTQDTEVADGTVFVDKTGNEWTYSGPTIEVLASDKVAKTIQVKCNDYGPIAANAGSITQTLEASYLVVTQPKDAELGRNDETDSELRARRTQSTGATGTTVLESLVGSLLSLDGIEDVQVINNVSGEDKISEDGTTIKNHNVYVIVRKNSGVEVTDESIGTIIYNKMTPGISTTRYKTVDDAQDKHYTNVADPNITWLNQTVYWKQATAIAPVCSVKISTLEHYATSTTTKIGQELMKYLNNLRLSKLPEKNQMIVTAMYADPTFKGAPTYVVDTITLPAISINPNTYFNYTKADVTTSGNDITITLS